MKKDFDEIADITKDILTQTATSGVLGGILQQALSGAEDHKLFLSIGIPAIGVAAVILQQVGLRQNNRSIELEIEKLEKTLGLIDGKMKRHQIDQLDNLFGAKLNVNMYQFIHNIFKEAVESKNESIRNYCSSMIVWAGYTEFDQGIEYRKLYRCLNIIKELDDLDFMILTNYDLRLQHYKCNNEETRNAVENSVKEILENEDILVQEIMLSINKLAKLGLFDKETTLYSYEDEKTKRDMVAQVAFVNALDRSTPTYNDFNKYVSTFI